jgi:DNA mismatch endonuclease, patch repair protein
LADCLTGEAMVDVVDKATRSRIMAKIRGKDTMPELIIRKALHKAGFRYRLHDKKLPGKPDLVFPKYKAVIQVNGCFWHGHGCRKHQWPASNREYWEMKIKKNVERDHKNIDICSKLGWRILIVWECAIKGKNSIPNKILVELIKDWLINKLENAQIQGEKQEIINWN